MAVRSKLETITPEKAKKILKNNTRNRPIRPVALDRVATALRRNEWEVNGESIKIAEDETLLDGQHRLMAVIQTNIPMDTFVTRGLPNTTQETMDQGTRRTLGDALKIRGEKEVNRLASVIRVVFSWERNGRPIPNVNMTVQEGIECLERNPGIRDSVSKMGLLGHKRWVSITTLAGLHYLFGKATNKAEADFFVEALYKGNNLNFDHPIIQVREKFITAYADKQEIHQMVRIALLIKAWNQHQAGTPGKVTFKAGGKEPENFPIIHGLERETEEIMKRVANTLETTQARNLKQYQPEKKEEPVAA